MSWKKVKLSEVLKQYRIEHRVDDKTIYKQVSILNDGSVVLRGEKLGKEIGRKRQFIIDTIKYPNTLIFTRQLLLQGSIGFASDDVHNCIVTENMPMFSVDTTKIDKEFLILFIKSKVFKARISQIELSGSAQKSIHEKTFLNLEFFLPPLQSQKEIATELLKFKIDFNKLSFELAYQFNLVKKLRQQLLQDAVQGKLVSQNPKDEPAIELLKKIKAEKEKLIAEKKIKKEKEFPPLRPDETPFEIPENWVWCRLGELGICRTGTTPATINKEYFGDYIPFIKPADITLNGLVTNNEGLSQLGLKEGVLVPNNSLLMVCIGGSIGKSYFTEFQVSCNQQINTISPLANIKSSFLQYFLQSNYFQKTVWAKASGGTTPIINRSKWESIFIPLPPLEEQKRIFQKLDILMQYCNELEASIMESESQNEKLLQQVLREALRKEPVEI